ncbi:MAG TPA: SUF system NifU family Fe-S cluster assembly protein [Casimicrobiaceae bacterium]
MTTDLRDLYQEVIFDHYKRPRNNRTLTKANHHAEGHNPLCGDKVTIYLKVEDGIIEDVTFEGSGCAIATASASMMTETLKGRRIDDVEKLFHGFHDMVTSAPDASTPSLGKLDALRGVREFPARVKCATLAWHTLQAALRAQENPVSTE